MTTLTIATEQAAPIVGPLQGNWTYADWERLPHDDDRYEIINGVLYMTTTPSLFHQWIMNRLVRFIGIPAEDRGQAYHFFAPTGVLMPGCDPVQPDFVVVRRERAAILYDRRVRGVPDLLIEVLSPSNRAYDQHIKREAYAAAGLPEYAIVDPAARVVYHYRLQPTGDYGEPTIVPEGATVTFDCLPELGVPVAELFAGAPDTTV